MSDSVAPQPSDPDQSSTAWPTPLPNPPQVPNHPVNWGPKRVCFYKSGDPRFNGLHMVINNRTFKTFDALLDSLSKKVSLPFGVRNITTPRGTHAVHSLHELEDGKSYICSDQKKVKPINLEAARKTLPPWTMTGPLSGHQATNRASQQSTRPLDASSTLQMPKHLTVFKNGNPSVPLIVTLQMRRSQTFESILRQVSEVMKFPVRKLFTVDGRRLDTLSAVLQCSGLVVASSQEPFRAASYRIQSPTQATLLSEGPGAKDYDRPHLQAGGTESRHFKSRKLSPSEMYFVNQMNNSITGSLADFPSNHTGSMETKNNHLGSVETESLPHVTNGRDPRSLVPSDDDIEKSFRINEDGSMTVEMKVRLTIKEEELIHWTTTLKRSTITRRVQVSCGMKPEPESPGSLEPPSDATIANSHDPEYYFSTAENKASSTSLNMDEPGLRRTATPGPGHVTWRQTSCESVTTMSDKEVTRNMLGAYSCTQEGPSGEVTEDHWLLCQTTSRPVPKARRPRFTEAEGYSASQSSDISEVLQTQTNSEAERKESVLHMCGGQSCSKKDSTCTKSGTGGETVCHRSVSADTIPCSMSCEQNKELKSASTASKSPDDRRSIALSLSPDPALTLDNITNSPCPSADRGALTPDSKGGPGEVECKDLIREDRQVSQIKEAEECKPNKRKPKGKMNINSPDKCSDTGRSNKSEADLPKNSRAVKPSDTFSPTGKQKKTDHTRKVTKNSPKLGKKQSSGDIDVAVVGPLLPLNITHLNGLLTHEEHKQTGLKALKDHKTNVDLKKNVLDVSPHSNLRETKKMLLKQNSEKEHQNISREAQPLTESVSLPIFCCGVNEYVENWLEKIQSESTDCIVNNSLTEETRAVFQIGSEFPEEPEESYEIKMLIEDKPCDYDPNYTRTVSVTQSLPETAMDQVQNDELHHRKTFNGTASSISIKPTVQVQPMTLGNSADPAPEDNLEPTLDLKKDVVPVLEQVCSEVPSVRQMSHHSQPSCLEKSYSFPYFTSHTASTPGSSSKLLAAFLSAIALNQIPTNTNTFKPFKIDGSCSEALGMIESLQNVPSMKDTEELKGSLSDLPRIDSCYLQNQKSFLDLDDRTETQSPFVENSTDNSAVDPSKDGDMSHGPPNDIKELLEEFSISTKFQKELINDDLTEHSEASKHLTDSGDDKNVPSETSKNDLQYEDSETDDKTQILEEGGYEDEHASDKDEKESHEELIRKEVFSGELHENHVSHFTLTKVFSEEDLKGTFEMSRRTPLISDHASEVQDKVEEDGEGGEAEKRDWEPSSYVEIPQDLLEFIHSALLSSTLSFSYDSKGNLIIEAKESQEKTKREILWAKGSTDVQYGHKRLPSPNTSDLSDYRSDTTDSEQFRSEDSAELLTESGEDDFKKLSFTQHSSRRITERIFGVSEVDIKSTMKTSFSSPHLEQHNNPKGSSTSKFSPLGRSCSGSEAAANTQHFNLGDPVDDCSEPGQCVVQSNPVDLSEGILIEKGRWLLKENHLIRRSPPEPMGMYGNIDTSSADTAHENGSDEEPHLGGPTSAFATISSSELEELAKPNPKPQLAYFNMPHGSDSDPFHDDSGSRSSLADDAIKESKIKKNHKLSTPTEPSTAWAKRRSSLNSFTSVQLKMPDGKVHPLDTQQATAQDSGTEAVQVQDSAARQDLTCGPHCPIL